MATQTRYRVTGDGLYLADFDTQEEANTLRRTLLGISALAQLPEHESRSGIVVRPYAVDVPEEHPL
jgi:hypothetical protein